MVPHSLADPGKLQSFRDFPGHVALRALARAAKVTRCLTILGLSGAFLCVGSLVRPPSLV